MFWWLACSTVPHLMRAHVIDVGQGSAMLLEFPCGAVLVDAGGERNRDFDSNAALVAYLDGFFARRPDLRRTLDGLVLTHPHLDHDRGAEAVLSRYTVRGLVTNGQEAGSGGDQQAAAHAWARTNGVPARRVDRTIVMDGVVDPVGACLAYAIDPVITAMWGDHGLGGNDDSVVLRVDFGESSLLVTGDLERDGIRDLLATRPDLDVDVLIVGHHGAKNGTNTALLDAVSPEVAVISCGPFERDLAGPNDHTARRFGHPHGNTIAALSRAISRSRPPRDVMVGVRGAGPVVGSEFRKATVERAIYATGWDGDVVIHADAAGTVVVTSSR